MKYCHALLFLLFPLAGLAQDQAGFTFRLLIETGEYDEVMPAEEIISEVTVLLPRASDAARPKLFLRRAQAYYHMGRYANTASDLQEVLRLDAKSAEAGTLLARALGNLGKKKEAAQLLANVIKEHPRHALALSDYAIVLLEEGKEIEGLQKLNESIDVDPKNGHAYLTRAIWFSNKGDFEHALKDLNTAMVVARWCDVATLSALRGYVLFKLGRYDESISCAQVAVRLDKDNKNAYLCLSLSSRNVGKWHSSAKYCMEMYKRWPEDAQVAAECIDAFLNVGLPDRAFEIARQSLKNLQRDANLYRALGRAFLWQRNYAQALKFYKAAADINEKDDGALSDLSYFLSSCPEASLRNGKEAIKLATSACELTSWREPWHVVVLANAYAEANDFSKAQHYGSMARKLVQSHPNSYIRARIEQMKGLFDKNQPHRVSLVAPVRSP